MLPFVKIDYNYISVKKSLCEKIISVKKSLTHRCGQKALLLETGDLKL